MTDFFFSSTFFFFSASCALKPVSWPSTALITNTRAGCTRVRLRVTEDEDDGFLDGVVSDLSHFSFFNLYEGVESFASCSGVSTLQCWHSESGFSTKGSLPFFLSRQRAQKLCKSKLAILWPHPPCR